MSLTVMSLYGQKPPNVNHHPTKFCGFRHCGHGDIMILVCHVILEDHVIKAVKSAIAIFFKAHGMSYSHIRNFKIKVALTKTFACVSSNSSLILATPPCIKNDEIYAKKLLQVRPKRTKCQITRFFPGNSHGGDKHGVTFTTTNISLHLTVTCSRLKNVLKAHFQV